MESTIGKYIYVTGHIVRSDVRSNMMFGELSDGVCVETIKYLHHGKKRTNDIIALAEAPVGSSVTLKGRVQHAPANAQQEYELEVVSAVVHSTVADPLTYPYGVNMNKQYTPEALKQRLVSLRENKHQRFRDRTFQAIMRLRSFIYAKLVEFLHERQFIKIDAPILTSSDCEGAGDQFEIKNAADFFNQDMYLSVSGQLELESAARELGKVYTFGKAFRAEHSRTYRHLAEFEMLELEKVLTDNGLQQIMDLQEDMIKYVIVAVLSNGGTAMDLRYLDNSFQSGIVDKLYKYKSESFKRITYTEVIEQLQNFPAGGEVKWGMDLSSAHENWLCEIYKCPVFVTDYPRDIKPFYMKSNGVDKTCEAVDLLVPGIGELSGGSMRQDDATLLKEEIERKNLSEDKLQWYIELRTNGGLPTGGFGLGFARLVSFITGVPNIRDVVPFPVTYKSG